jgi:TRAP-type C4-dicarboxylate transport system permease small subunit
MESLKVLAEKVDDAIFRIERVLLVVSLAMMTVLVALDVTQRTFSRPEGKTAGMILWVLERGGAVSEATRSLVNERLGPVAFAILAAVGLVLAAHSRRLMSAAQKKLPAPGFGPSLGLGLAAFTLLTILVQALLYFFPSSVPGAQKFALGFMLWSGLLGASLATRTRRHIILDPVKKKMSEPTQRQYALLGGLVTFGFCALLAYLGWKQLFEEIHEWSTGEGVGVFDALPIPKWVSTLAIPVSFTVMSLRFLAQGINDLVWGPPKGGADAHGIDLEKLEQEKLEEEGA